VMKRVLVFVGVMGTAALAAGAVACNSLLGIGAASQQDEVEAGLTCAYYCQEINQNCSGANAEYILGDCMTMCQTLGFDQGDTIRASNDDTLGCRIFYAEQAAMGDNANNCRFASAMGGGRCGNAACQHFCALDVPYCGTTIKSPAYASPAECLSDCLPDDAGKGGYVLTTDGGSTGTDLPDGTNTLNCRFYHLENAWPDQSHGITHCPHTAKNSPTCF
jgi:hypothetical protein